MVSTAAKSPSASKTKKTDTRRTAILVLGMHRSGTSALTRVLNLVGCDLPKTLMQSNPTNEAGHWESDVVCRLNDRILESAGSSWHDWLELNLGWFESPKAEQFRDEAVAVLSEEFGTSRLFVFKDPRNCRLLPFWLDAIERSNARPLAFLPIRNPLEVAASLEKRNGFEPALGHLLWLRHVLDAEAASRHIPRLFSTYDQLMQSWGQLVQSAQTALGVSWPRLSDLSAAEIDNFLLDRHRHHQTPSKSVVDNPGLSAWLRETYSIMQSWAATGEKEADRSALDRIRGEFNAAAPAFSRLIAAGQAARLKASKLEKSLLEEAGKLHAAQASMTATEQKAKQVGEELAAARGRIAEIEKKAAGLQTELVKRETSLQAAETARAELERQRGKMEALLGQERERATRLEEEVAKLHSRLAEEGQSLAALRTELEAAEDAERLTVELRGRLAATESALAQRQLETEQTAVELAVAREEIERTGRLHAEGEQVIAGLKEHVNLLLVDAKERAALSAELDKVRREVDQARASRQSEAEAAKAELTQLRRELAEARRAAEAAHSRTVAAQSETDRLRADISEGEQSARNERAQLAERLKAEAEQMRQTLAAEMGKTVSALLDETAWRLLPNRLRVVRKMVLLKRSGLFDAEWYKARYKDVAESGIDPLRHYVVHGALEGREPNRRLAESKSTATGI